MDFFPVLLLAGVGASALLSIYKQLAQGLARKKMMSQRAMRSMRELSGNQLASVKGKVTALSEPLIAPFSGEACVCFEVLVEEYTKEDNERPWVTLAQDTLRQNFSLTQDDESALIRVQYAEISLVTSSAQCYMRKAPPRIQEFLERRGDFSWGDRFIRYSEGALLLNQQVMASGFARREADLQAESAGYRDQATRLIFQHEDEYPLYISNDPMTFT